MEIGHIYPDETRSPIRDKEESDPLSYNSRPFNTNSSLKGLSETRYDRSDGYTGNANKFLYFFNFKSINAFSFYYLQQEFENIV